MIIGFLDIAIQQDYIILTLCCKILYYNILYDYNGNFFTKLLIILRFKTRLVYMFSRSTSYSIIIDKLINSVN